MLQKFASITQWLRLPAVCNLCHHFHDNQQTVCQHCTSLFTRIDQGCTLCRLPLGATHFLLCGHCIKHKPIFDKVLSSYCYTEPLRTLIHLFKYQKKLFLGKLFVELMLEALPNTAYRPDCLIPVPMHPQKIRQKGFNHAAELTKRLAARLSIPYNLTLCKKIIATPAQINLTNKQRRHNLKKAFSVKPHHYQHITIIDDLLTTGSTANELAFLLKQQGAKQVDIWCLARTPV